VGLSTSGPASCGPHDQSEAAGTASAPGEAQTPNGSDLGGDDKRIGYSFPRRDRWGKLNRILCCKVCGRRLNVNWVRARPCLFCDLSVEEGRG